MTKVIDVAICDDHQIVRDGLKQIMGLYPDIKVVGDDIASGETLIRCLKVIHPDVIILDISLPGRSGLEVLKQVKALYPKIGVLILSMYPEDQFAIRMLKAGASGYLNKDTPPEILVEAVRTISKGEEYISPDVANLLVGEVLNKVEEKPHKLLSDREYEVLLLLGQGNSVTEIGEKLSLSVKTISTYRLRLMSKLKLQSNADIVKYSIRNGILAID
ncbi:MAG: DNA-binding response regulator [Bacteroidetes bacterium]|nr:MAG: DNA-binding response regulator [Bacteroidota bacterium]